VGLHAATSCPPFLTSRLTQLAIDASPRGGKIVIPAEVKGAISSTVRMSSFSDGDVGEVSLLVLSVVLLDKACVSF